MRKGRVAGCSAGLLYGPRTAGRSGPWAWVQPLHPGLANATGLLIVLCTPAGLIEDCFPRCFGPWPIQFRSHRKGLAETVLFPRRPGIGFLLPAGTPRNF